jgi:hypothetical protein
MLESDSNAVNLKVQLGVWDLYWSMWRMFFTLPVALMLLVVVGLMILADFRDRTLDTVSFSVPVFLVVTFFAVVYARRKGLAANETTISGVGITTDWGSRSYSVRWEWIKDASESDRYVWVRFKTGHVLIPKRQLTESNLAAVRAILREHLREKARVRV